MKNVYIDLLTYERRSPNDHLLFVSTKTKYKMSLRKSLDLSMCTDHIVNRSKLLHLCGWCSGPCNSQNLFKTVYLPVRVFSNFLTYSVQFTGQDLNNDSLCRIDSKDYKVIGTKVRRSLTSNVKTIFIKEI